MPIPTIPGTHDDYVRCSYDELCREAREGYAMIKQRPSAHERLARALESHTARTRARRLGARQHRILLYARLREAGGQAFPSPRECADHLGYRGPASDCKASILGLAVRGLIARDAAGWHVTPEGWAVS